MAVSFRQGILALLVFGISFGFIEAAIVVYLRTLTAPHRQAAGLARDELFPVLTPRKGPVPEEVVRVWRAEQLREAATLALLWSAGMALGKTGTARFAVFLVAFGLWDIFFYAGLRYLIQWPASLLTPDLLFLLPVPWWGPVLAPLLAASVMVGGGCLYLWRPFRVGAWHWAGIFSGSAMMIVAFCWDAQLLLEGGVPGRFVWPVYLTGLGIAVAATSAARRTGRA